MYPGRRVHRRHYMRPLRTSLFGIRVLLDFPAIRTIALFLKIILVPCQHLNVHISHWSLGKGSLIVPNLQPLLGCLGSPFLGSNGLYDIWDLCRFGLPRDTESSSHDRTLRREGSALGLTFRGRGLGDGCLPWIMVHCRAH